MKLLRFGGIFLIAMLMSSVSHVSFADQAHLDKEQAFIKLLNDSAAALKATKPELARDLTAFSKEEAREMDEEKAGKKEAEEKDEAKIKERRSQHMKTLKDSASALRVSHPELSSALEKRADKISKKMAGDKKEGQNRKKEE